MSFLSTTANVTLGRPLDQGLCISSNSTSLLAGPASLIFVAVILLLTLNIPPYKFLLVTCGLVDVERYE